MKRPIAYPFLTLALFLFCWVNLPKNWTDRIRSIAVASFGHFFDRPENSSTEIARLQLENQTLRAQIDQVYEWLLGERHIAEQAELYKSLLQEQTKESAKRPFLQRRADHLRNLLKSQLVSIPAQVIYRDPSSWSSSVWVNMGDDHNRAFGQTIIAKNSPVVSGGALVGVVDHVGAKQTRIRLITDSGLSPAVRAVRGAGEYLAKGEVHGSSAPFWRSRGLMLKGIGFNYDYADEEGPSRDLKTGRPIGFSGEGAPLLREGDLLVTSGLDGVFPPGLRVGTVARTHPLKEGGYAYEIEVRPEADHLNDLRTVFILPPLSE